MILKPFFTAVFIITVSSVCAQPAKPANAGTEAKFPASDAYAKSNITSRIINSPNQTFGYDIIADGKMIIHQPSVPGMPGNEGFETKESAGKVSQLVIAKIKKGEMPPTITKEEMQKLKAIK